MKNYFLVIGIAFLLLAGGFVFAQTELEGIAFPVEELGNCASKDECADFCDLPENMGPCLDFAEENNLLPQEEIEMARKMLEAGAKAGPGGCQGQAECADFCDNIDNLEECIGFAEEYDLMPPEELEEAQKVLAAMRQGIQPPNCQRKSECDAYCSLPENMEECITFGEAAGLIPPEELEMAKKVLELSKQGITPPPCRGDRECDEYCAIEEHFEECISFAEAAGFVSPEDAAMARKTGGKGPGGCRGQEECDAFCEDPANMAACMEFGLEYGFIPPEEAENVRKTLEAIKKGFTPPKCQGEEECQVYCSQPENTEACFNFAEAAGFMTPEEAANARQGMQMMQQGGPGGCTSEEECKTYCEEPANFEECIDFGERAGLMNPEEADEARQGMQMMQRGGPGGCTSEEECKVYCEDPDNLEECMDFSAEQGFMSPEEVQQIQEMMEGGLPEGGQPPMMRKGFPPELEGKCSTGEECNQYCAENPLDSDCLEVLENNSMPEEIPFEGEIPEGIEPPSFEEFEQMTPQGPTPEEIQEQIFQQIPPMPPGMPVPPTGE